MKKKSEAQIEEDLIKQLKGQGYERIVVEDEEAMLTNLKKQLALFNKTTFSKKEFDSILNHLAKGNYFQKAKTLRDRFQLSRDNDEVDYIQFFDSEDLSRNVFQVTNQISQEGTYKTRYDVTLLVNGLPLVQIELKRRDIEIKEAFNQLMRYDRHSFNAGYGLFQFVQIFVTSNEHETKYFANTYHKNFSFEQTFHWAKEDNQTINDLYEFSTAFLDKNHLADMIANYVVISESMKILMVLRPYQYYAVKAIVNQVRTSDDNGYIWHTTGSGKTLTSFKASQVVLAEEDVRKVVFVVDRKDLDHQTAEEFNKFKDGSVDMTTNTSSLVDQLADTTPLTVTTIQKLNNAITKPHYQKKIEHLKSEKIVFIFDECHRSQFGNTHKAITNFFTKAQMFGFTGTPIFKENTHKNDFGKRTTKDLFGKRLHEYVITDAIRDENVLRFGVEYVGRYKKKGRTLLDIEVAAIDTKEIFDDEVRIGKIVDYIIENHDVKTRKREFSAILTVSSKENLYRYFQQFQQKREEGKHDLRVAGIYSYGTNEDDPEARAELPGDVQIEKEHNYSYAADREPIYEPVHSREKLDAIITDYNKQYNVAFSTKDKLFEAYYRDICKRLKSREKENFKDKDRLDIVIVVNMMLTGFDAKKLNTLYVDKNLKHHGLIQAYSRTNRILTERKSQGNIVCFRNLQEATDEAVALFSDIDATEEIFLPEYEKIVLKFKENHKSLVQIAFLPEDVKGLKDEEEELQFVQAFRRLMRVKNMLATYLEFEWSDLSMTEEQFTSFSEQYLNIKDKVKRQSTDGTDKASVLDDIDFELDILRSDIINVAYILRLLAKIKPADKESAAKQKKQILDMLAGDVKLRSKRELIEKFIEENLPHISDLNKIDDEFEQYWQDQKVLALGKICKEENLDKAQFKALIDAYIFSGQEPIRDDVFKCLDNRPSILKARSIGQRILEKMKEYIEVFIEGMVA